MVICYKWTWNMYIFFLYSVQSFFFTLYFTLVIIKHCHFFWLMVHGWCVVCIVHFILEICIKYRLTLCCYTSFIHYATIWRADVYDVWVFPKCAYDAHRQRFLYARFRLVVEWFRCVDYSVHSMLCRWAVRTHNIVRSFVLSFVHLYNTFYSVHAYRIDSIPWSGSKIIKQIRLGWIVDRIGCILLRCCVVYLTCAYFV